MIAGTRPSVIFISNFNQESGESDFSHSARRHEGEEEWVIVCFDIRHGVCRPWAYDG